MTPSARSARFRPPVETDRPLCGPRLGPIRGRATHAPRTRTSAGRASRAWECALPAALAVHDRDGLGPASTSCPGLGPELDLARRSDLPLVGEVAAAMRPGPARGRAPFAASTITIAPPSGPRRPSTCSTSRRPEIRVDAREQRLPAVGGRAVTAIASPRLPRLPPRPRTAPRTGGARWKWPAATTFRCRAGTCSRHPRRRRSRSARCARCDLPSDRAPRASDAARVPARGVEHRPRGGPGGRSPSSRTSPRP